MIFNKYLHPQKSKNRPKKKMISAGLEPAIPGSVGRCLIHWATGPRVDFLGEMTAGQHNFPLICLHLHWFRTAARSFAVWRASHLDCDRFGVDVKTGNAVAGRAEIFCLKNKLPLRS